MLWHLHCELKGMCFDVSHLMLALLTCIDIASDTIERSLLLHLQTLHIYALWHADCSESSGVWADKAGSGLQTVGLLVPALLASRWWEGQEGHAAWAGEKIFKLWSASFADCLHAEPSQAGCFSQSSLQFCVNQECSATCGDLVLALLSWGGRGHKHRQTGRQVLPTSS